MSDKILARFSRGQGAMGVDFIDYYICKGEIIKRQWGMGGETKSKVKSIPKSIDGYKCVTERELSANL